MKTLVLAFVLALAPSLGAQETRLADLVSEALAHNREILVAQKVFEAAQARKSVDSSLPDPHVAVGYRSTSNPLPIAGIGREKDSNAGISFTQDLPFPGKLKLSGERAASHAKATFQAYESTKLAVVARLKQAYFQLEYLGHVRETIARDKDLLEKFTRIAEARYTVGRGTQQDVLKAQTEQTRLMVRLAKLENDEGVARAEILALLNRAPGSALGTPAASPKVALAQGVEELLAAAQEHSPLLGHDRNEIDFTIAGLNLARRGYYPDFSATGGYYNYAGLPGEYEFRLDVKVPLYFWRKQRSEVQEKVSNVSEWRHQYEADAQMLNQKVKTDYLAVKAALQLADLYEKGVLPQATLTLESSLTGYETGAVDFLTLLTNFMTVLETELSLHGELAAYHKALARLEESTGLRLL